MIPYRSLGVTCPASGVEVHGGFLQAYNAVAMNMLSNVSAQLGLYPTYSLVAAGHSLGGALASLAGVSLKSNFPNSSVRLFTFGQPRTGNEVYAALVEELIGMNNIFRGVYYYRLLWNILRPYSALDVVVHTYGQ